MTKWKALKDFKEISNFDNRINTPDSHQFTLLCVASQDGNIIDVCNLLSKKGILINKESHSGATPLFMAASRGHKEITEALLHAGAEVNIANIEHCTPLFMAAQNAHEEIVEALLKNKGIDVNRADIEGCTPLFIAAQEGHKAIIEKLLDAGADIY